MRRHRTRLMLESLETREVPATMVSPTTLTYQDADGDDVKVVLSKPVLNANNVNSIFTFDMGSVNNDNSMKQQLQTIKLTGLNVASGTNITVTGTPSAKHGGDGFAAVGQIDAKDLDLGVVTVDGDLGNLWAGDPTVTTTGVKGLTVQSIGRYGKTTGAPFTRVFVSGSIDALTVKSDVNCTAIEAFGGSAAKIGTATIGGSLIGGEFIHMGSIVASGDIGAVTVKGDVIGGDGPNAIWSGSISSQGKIGSVTIGGSLKGGTGGIAGRIQAMTGLGPVKIGGNVIAGWQETAAITCMQGNIASVTIGGDLVGKAMNSGYIWADGTVGPVTIGGSVVGGVDDNSGHIFSTGGKVTGVTIGGELIGGVGKHSGSITAKTDIGPVKIGGNVIGNDMNSAEIVAEGKLAAVTIGGSLIGGAASKSGVISSTGDMGDVKISGSVVGGGPESGMIFSAHNLASVTMGGSLRGGFGACSGEVWAFGKIGSVNIRGDLVGGSASGNMDLWESGCVRAANLQTVVLGGSLFAGTDTTTGQYYVNGAICASDSLGSVTIKGNVVGNTTNHARITGRGSASATPSTDVAIGSLTIGGNVTYADIFAGVLTYGLNVNADAQIGAVTVGGDWICSNLAAGIDPGPLGYYGAAANMKMSGGGVKDANSLTSKIGAVNIGGQVMGTFGMFDFYGIVAESLGAVRIGGTPLKLTTDAHNDAFGLGITGDVNVREV